MKGCLRQERSGQGRCGAGTLPSPWDGARRRGTPALFPSALSITFLLPAKGQWLGGPTPPELVPWGKQGWPLPRAAAQRPGGGPNQHTLPSGVPHTSSHPPATDQNTSLWLCDIQEAHSVLHTWQELENPAPGPADQRLEPSGSLPREGAHRTSFWEDSGTGLGGVGCSRAAGVQSRRRRPGRV